MHLLVFFAAGWFRIIYYVSPYVLIGLLALLLVSFGNFVLKKDRKILFGETSKILFVSMIFVSIFLFGKLVVEKNYPTLLASSSGDDDDGYYESLPKDF
jgi:predicted PurR-regulated permease PerM